MIRTRVGYAGGTKNGPTYRAMGDHTEAFEIDFDPTVIRFETLVEEFWRAHNPCRNAWSRQYANILFWNSDEQRQVAEASLARATAQNASRGDVHTAVREATRFWLAEDYHQKWTLRRHADLTDELTAIYPDAIDFANSTVAMRLNAWLDGAGTAEQIAAEVDLLGLSDASKERVLALTARQRGD